MKRHISVILLAVYVAALLAACSGGSGKPEGPSSIGDTKVNVEPGAAAPTPSSGSDSWRRDARDEEKAARKAAQEKPTEEAAQPAQSAPVASEAAAPTPPATEAAPPPAVTPTSEATPPATQ